MTSCRTLLSIFATLLIIISACLLFYPMGYLYATYENLYGEWLQFSAFVGITVFSFLIVKNKLQAKLWFWYVLGVAAFYVAGEEISWGQQFFGWTSSAYFQANNLQGETNLHNMFTGPYKTLLKEILTYGLAFGIVAYGVLFPLCLRNKWLVAIKLEAWGIPAQPLCLSPIFALAALFELAVFNFNETEVAEMLIALVMCFFAAIIYFNTRAGVASGEGAINKKLSTVMVVLLVAAFSFTQLSLHSSTSKDRVANRIEAGVKKFAGRYARVGAWDHAIDLYERHLSYSPESRSRLRRLAEAYESAGYMDEYQVTIQKALALDLARLEEDRWRASLHRSLYKTYRVLGDYESADMHIGRALAINRDRLAETPNSASAAYSFALTLELVGKKREAIEQFRRAVELNPDRRKYRSAYRDAIY